MGYVFSAFGERTFKQESAVNLRSGPKGVDLELVGLNCGQKVSIRNRLAQTAIYSPVLWPKGVDPE